MKKIFASIFLASLIALSIHAEERSVKVFRDNITSALWTSPSDMGYRLVTHYKSFVILKLDNYLVLTILKINKGKPCAIKAGEIISRFDLEESRRSGRGVHVFRKCKKDEIQSLNNIYTINFNENKEFRTNEIARYEVIITYDTDKGEVLSFDQLGDYTLSLEE